MKDTLKTIEIINIQKVWVECISTIELTEQEYSQLESGDIKIEELFDRCEHLEQTDMWSAEEENDFEYRCLEE